jgi:hypothetical protein
MHMKRCRYERVNLTEFHVGHTIPVNYTQSSYCTNDQVVRGFTCVLSSFLICFYSNMNATNLDKRLSILDYEFRNVQEDIKKVQEEFKKAEAERKDYWRKFEADQRDNDKKFSIIEGFIRREAEAIEVEVTKTVQKYLLENWIGHQIYVPSNFPKKIGNQFNYALPLTDFDGVFILTDNPEIAEDHNELSVYVNLDAGLENDMQARTQMLSALKKDLKPIDQKPYKTTMTIIEAKHHVTKEKIDVKLNQLDLIQQWLTDAKRTLESPTNVEGKMYDKKFVKNVNMFKFNNYDDKPLLFMGGTVWDIEAIQYFKAKMKEAKYTDRIFMILTNGTRYTIYGKASATHFGGKKKGSRK